MKNSIDLQEYNFERYVDKERWASYYCQVNEIIRLKPKKILIIGKGDGIVENVARQILNNNVVIQTFDFDERLSPDIVGDVKDISKIVNEKYDCIVCCQVLEHLPGGYLNRIMKEFSLLKCNNFIISIPNIYRFWNVKLRFRLRGATKVKKLEIKKFYIKNVMEYFKGREHYWEMGMKGYDINSIRSMIKVNFYIEKEYFVENNEYHYFFILRRKERNQKVNFNTDIL